MTPKTLVSHKEEEEEEEEEVLELRPEKKRVKAE